MSESKQERRDPISDDGSIRAGRREVAESEAEVDTDTERDFPWKGDDFKKSLRGKSFSS